MKHLKHKFHAKPTVNDGIKFASKKEANYYNVLKTKQASGEILFFLRQVPLHLPGQIRYVVDFLVFYANGSVEFIDVKGVVTPVYKTKKAIAEATYPIQIVEV